MNEALLRQLRSLVGEDRVKTQPEYLRAFSMDASPLSVKRCAVKDADGLVPEAVVEAGTEEDVAAVVAFASKHGIAVTPRGMGSSVVGSSLPLTGGIVLDMRSLNQIVEFDETSRTVRVQAGVLGGELEEQLNRLGYTTHFSPQSLSRSTVGGWVATRATGQFSSRWGGIEDLVTGLDVVLGSGDRVHISGSPRAAVGPDLRHLFIGGEGVFGVVVQVTLRFFAIVPARVLEAFRVPATADGLTLMRQIMQSGLQPFLLRLYDPAEAEHVFGHASGGAGSAPLLLVGFEGAQRVAGAEMEEVRQLAGERGATSVGEDPVRRWLESRFDFSAVERVLSTPGGVAETFEVAATWDRIEHVYDTLRTRLGPQCVKVFGHFSHAYTHGTSLYVIVVAEAGDELGAYEQTLRLWDVAMTACLETGAVLSHHHGVGLARLRYLPEALGPNLAILRAIKSAVDPHSILCPGKLAASRVRGQAAHAAAEFCVEAW